MLQHRGRGIAAVARQLCISGRRVAAQTLPLRTPAGGAPYHATAGQQESSPATPQSLQTTNLRVPVFEALLPAAAAGMSGNNRCGAVAVDAGVGSSGTALNHLLGGRQFIVMPAEEAVPTMASVFQEGGLLDWRVAQHEEQQPQNACSALPAMAPDGCLADWLHKIDLDGIQEWEEMQAGSVMKKRKKAMNKHKWKKRRKRDRSYSR
jgi:hypothetical protein